MHLVITTVWLIKKDFTGPVKSRLMNLLWGSVSVGDPISSLLYPCTSHTVIGHYHASLKVTVVHAAFSANNKVHNYTNSIFMSWWVIWVLGVIKETQKLYTCPRDKGRPWYKTDKIFKTTRKAKGMWDNQNGNNLDQWHQEYRQILSVFLSVYLPTFPPTCHLSLYLSMYLLMYVSNYLSSIYLSIHLSIYLSMYVSIYLSFIYLSTYLPISIFISMYLCIYVFISLSSIYQPIIYLPTYHLSLYLCMYLSTYHLCIFIFIHPAFPSS